MHLSTTYMLNKIRVMHARVLMVKFSKRGSKYSVYIYTIIDDH